MANFAVHGRQTRSKFLTCICVLVQEIVEDPVLAARFRNWAGRLGEDETDACVLHNSMYDMLQRHVMGITAAQP